MTITPRKRKLVKGAVGPFTEGYYLGRGHAILLGRGDNTIDPRMSFADAVKRGVFEDFKAGYKAGRKSVV